VFNLDGKEKFLQKAYSMANINLTFIKNSDGSTTLIQSEKFSGILVPLFSKMINTNTPKGFELMNEKIKEVAEK
jgi:hypothetical protein